MCEAKINSLTQNSIKFLHNVTTLNCLNVPAIKSIYSTKYRILELRSHNYLPSNLTKDTKKCKKCLINFNDGPASHNVKHVHKTDFAKKVLAKRERGEVLTKFQTRYLKKMKYKEDNQLVITCKFCTNETIVALDKPRKVSKVQNISEMPSTNKKKKNKKKDKFCGLNQNAVLSAVKHKPAQKLFENTPPRVTTNNENNNSKILNLNNSTNIGLTFSNIKINQKGSLNKVNNGKINKPKEQQSNKKNKKTTLEKLNQMMSDGNSKKTPTNNLKHFLKGL